MNHDLETMTMAAGILLDLKIPQSTIKVSVEYYDEAERKKFLSYSNVSDIGQLVTTGFEIPIEEFLTYYLFYKKRPGKDGWRNYQEIGLNIAYALAELSGFVDFNGVSLSTPKDTDGQDRAITERIGESVGLSVVSRIHGLTAADWGRLPIIDKKSFDYEVAGIGNLVIQMEAKGSSIADNSVKAPTVSNHKASIHGKKNAINTLSGTGSYRYPADLRYGTITVMGESTTDPVKCLLVDPPADGDGNSALQLKLIQRLKFICDWISFISPRSQFASALQTRIASIENLPDPRLLDGVPLLKGNGEPFEYGPMGWMPGQHSSFFSSKCRITDGPAGGVVVPLPNGNLFFLGIREDLLEQAASQKIDQIANYKAEQGSVRKTVRCMLTMRAFKEFKLPSRLIEGASKEAGYYAFNLEGQIQYSNTGILFGVLPTHE